MQAGGRMQIDRDHRSSSSACKHVQLCVLGIHQERRVAGGEKRLILASRRGCFGIQLLPRIAGVRAGEDGEVAIHLVADQRAEGFASELEGVPESARVRVRENKFPGSAAIRGFVEARKGAGTGGHNDGGVSVEGLNAPEVQLFGPGRNSASFPGLAVVGGVQDPALRATGPYYAAADVMDAPQASRGMGLL